MHCSSKQWAWQRFGVIRSIEHQASRGSGVSPTQLVSLPGIRITDRAGSAAVQLVLEFVAIADFEPGAVVGEGHRNMERLVF